MLLALVLHILCSKLFWSGCVFKFGICLFGSFGLVVFRYSFQLKDAQYIIRWFLEARLLLIFEVTVIIIVENTFFLCLSSALQKLKEKKLKCVSMVLPCIMRQIKSVELLDELTENEPDDEEGRIIHVIQSVLDHMNDFLRPLVQECTAKTSCSAMVN